ncbi:hypothetical protein Tco_0886118 [Tanacetum coccineum]
MKIYSQQRVLDLENTKTTQAREITSLKLRVKKLEKKRGSRTHKLGRLYKVGRSARVVSSNEASLGDQEDASKQGRKILLNGLCYLSYGFQKCLLGHTLADKAILSGVDNHPPMLEKDMYDSWKSRGMVAIHDERQNMRRT